MVALTPSPINESYVEPSPYSWLRSRAPVPTSYAPACAPLYPFQGVLEKRTSRARGRTGYCAEVVERKYLICIEIWQVELESCVWQVSFHKYAYVHGDPIQGIDPTGQFLSILVGVGIGIGHMANELVAGGLIIGLLNNVGKPAFDLRAMGLALIAQGDFELGFKLYDVSTAVIGKVFETMETIDGAIGIVSIGPAIITGALKLVKNSPEMIQTAMNASRAFHQSVVSMARRGRNISEIFNSTKFLIPKDPEVIAKGLDQIDELHKRFSKSPNKPDIEYKFANVPETDRNGRRVFGRYDPVENKVYLFKDHDGFTVAEELKHWEDHTRNLNGKSYQQFGQDWNRMTRSERDAYIDDLEADAETWFNSIGFTPRSW